MTSEYNDTCTLPDAHKDACNGHPRPSCCAPMPAPLASNLVSELREIAKWLNDQAGGLAPHIKLASRTVSTAADELERAPAPETSCGAVDVARECLPWITGEKSRCPAAWREGHVCGSTREHDAVVATLRKIIEAASVKTPLRRVLPGIDKPPQ